MIFAVFDPSPLTVCINCIFYIHMYIMGVTSTAVGWVGYSAEFVCLSVCLIFHTFMSQKPMQLGTPNLTQTCLTISPGKLKPIYFGGQKIKGQGHKAVVGLCALVSDDFF